MKKGNFLDIIGWNIIDIIDIDFYNINKVLFFYNYFIFEGNIEKK